MACAVCGFAGGSPSDHEPWCPCFMRGPVGVEGQTDLLEQLDELERCAVCGEPVTPAELARVRSDVDFVEHGGRGHLIRLETTTTQEG